MIGRQVLGVLVLAAASQAGDSLVDGPRKEKERRARIDRPARSFTDADLPTRPPRPEAEASPSPSASPAPSPSPSPALTEDESAARRRREQEWRARFASARERWHTVVEMVYVSGIPVQQQVKKFEESQDLRDARKALEDLEEELRRSGSPPGWGRE